MVPEMSPLPVLVPSQHRFLLLCLWTLVFPTFSLYHEVFLSPSAVDLIRGLCPPKGWGDSILSTLSRSVPHRYRGAEWKEWVASSSHRGVFEECVEPLSQSNGCHSFLVFTKWNQFRDHIKLDFLGQNGFPPPK